MPEFGDEDIIAGIRKRDALRREAEAEGIIGGMRESFEISRLLTSLDERDRMLDQIQKLSDQALGGTFTSVNAYRLDAALKGEHVID